MSNEHNGPELDPAWAMEPGATADPRSFFPMRPSDPGIRPLPYPFRGAVALSNDAEYLQFDFFETLMRFLNTRESTPFGPGLGLRVTSSLFFFSAHDYNFSYFKGAGASAARSGVADRLDDYLRAGWIDTIHAYGDFDGVGGCTREHALATFRALDAMRVKLEVFSNHGGTDNVQNIGTDAAYHRGDHADHPAYHSDLLAGHGIRYVWTDSLVVSEQRPTGWRSALSPRRPPLSDLLVPTRLHDGREFVGFRRLRGTGAYAPNLASLLTQVQQISWPDLYQNWGASVIYQHLGVLQRSAGVCLPATIEAVLRRPEVYLTPFRILQQQQDSGRLWVCGCAELLRYAEMIRSVTLHRDPEKASISLEFPRPVENPASFFAGLTLVADPRQGLEITYAGRPLATTWNGPESLGGNYSVTVTQRPPAGIW